MRFIASFLVLVLTAACGDDDGAGTTDPVATTGVATTSRQGPPSGTEPAGTLPSTTSLESTTSTTAPPETTTTPEPSISRATGSGTVVLDDATAHEVEVVACGWLSSGGSDQPLEAGENSRRDFRLTAVGQEDEAVLVVSLDRDGRVGVTYIDVLHVIRGSDSDDPRNFWWSNERQNHTRVIVEGGAVTTPEPLIVLEDTTDIYSTSHDIDIAVTCETFGGIPRELPEQVAEVTGIELPTFGSTGTLTIDDTTYAITTVSCRRAGSLEGLAEAPEHDLVVSVSDHGTEAAGILSDTIGIDIGERSLIADQDVDIVIDGTNLRTSVPVMLFDLYTRQPAGMATVSIDCG